MSFLKISDPVKRDLIVKEYLELKKNIRDNLLSERTGELELQTDLSKFYRPITETQKATVREITEGLRPIKEGIENLPQAIKFPPIQPLGEASGQEKLFEKLLEPFEEEASEEEKPLDLGEIAKEYLYRKEPYPRDATFGIREEKGLYYIGNKQATIVNNNILIEDENFEGTPGLWKLLMTKTPKYFSDKDYNNYARLMLKTNALHQNNNPNNPHPKSSSGKEWLGLLSPIWEKYKEEKKEE